MTEVHEQAELVAGRVQIIEDLSAMFVGQRRNGFEFDDDFAKTNEIGLISLSQRSTAVTQGQLRLRNGRNLQVFELDFHALLINRLKESAALVLVNREASSNDRVAFRFEQKIVDFVFHFACLACLAGASRW